MLFKNVLLLASLGQAHFLSSRSDPLSKRTKVKGALTSVRVLEGNGCPAGTYRIEPIEPGKSLNTYVQFQSWVFDSDTSVGPLNCTLSIDFNYKYPNTGKAEVSFGTVSYLKIKYKDTDRNKKTHFVLRHNITAHVDTLNLSNDFNFPATTPKVYIGTSVFPSSKPGATGYGNFTTDFSLFTEFARGEAIVSRVNIGFDLDK